MSETGEKGVLARAPSDLFENLDAGEAQLLADSQPFPARPQPIGGSRKGVPNKRNAQMRDLYLRMGLPHPLLWQGQLLQRGVDQLAKDLDCKAIEAAELLAKVADRIAPYIEGKQPTAIKVEGGAGLPVLVLGELAAAREGLAQARDEGALAIDDELDAAIGRHERNQGLSHDDE